MRTFLITEQQLQAVLEYLTQRPMVEVEQAVSVLRRLPVSENWEHAARNLLTPEDFDRLKSFVHGTTE